MLQDKRVDLDSEKRKKLIQRLLAELSRTQPDLYYQPTSEIARQIKNYIDGDANLIVDERSLLETLSQRDIEVILSLH
ncbi:MAG: hypothetical protein AAGF59_05320 [Pseudomonadota bacterium]